MAEQGSDAEYHVWGVDRAAYGPVDVATLVSWVKDERVTADTWVFRSSDGSWQKASALPALQELFPAKPQGPSSETKWMRKFKAPDISQLRGIRILAALSDEQLGHVARFGEVEDVSAGHVLVRQGDRDEALYLILAGEMRVRILVDGAETVLTTLRDGDCFGDLALLDHGPRSADVVANTQCTVVRVSGEAFAELCQSEGDTSTFVLRALDKTLTERIRADNQRYGNALRGKSST